MGRAADKESLHIVTTRIFIDLSTKTSHVENSSGAFQNLSPLRLKYQVNKFRPITLPATGCWSPQVSQSTVKSWRTSLRIYQHAVSSVFLQKNDAPFCCYFCSFITAISLNKRRLLQLVLYPEMCDYFSMPKTCGFKNVSAIKFSVEEAHILNF